MISTNYNGGDPTAAYWEDLQPVLSSGGWSWTFSGNIDIAAFAQGEVNIAFKYTSTDTESATWEIDNIKVYGQMGTGIKPVVEPQNRIYPNPAVNKVMVNLAANAQISIYALTGEKVMEKNLLQGVNTIEISNLHSGVYLVKIQMPSRTETHRLIVK